MLDAIKDSFAIHYFGGKIGSGQVPFSKKSVLYEVMKPYCPKAAKFFGARNF
jgi:hypothetical protein